MCESCNSGIPALRLQELRRTAGKKETQVSGVRAIPVPPRKWGGPEGILRRDSGLPMGFSTQCQRCIYVVPQPISTKCINSLLRSCQESWIFFQAASHACMHAKSLQSCPTLCGPMDYSLPGSSVHRILQARILEWVAILFSKDLLDPGIKHRSPALQADYLQS